MIFKISSSVWRMPSRARMVTLLTVSSRSLPTIPSPEWKDRPFMDRVWARIAAPTEEAILAAQLGFAPSQMMPETLARVLVMVRLMVSKSPPHR